MTEDENFLSNGSQFSLPSYEDSNGFSPEQFNFSVPDGENLFANIAPFEINEQAEPSILSLNANDNKAFSCSNSSGIGSGGFNLFLSGDQSEGSFRKSSPSSAFLSQEVDDANEETIEIDRSLWAQRKDIEKLEKISQKQEEEKSVLLKDPNHDCLSNFELINNDGNSAVRVDGELKSEFPKTVKDVEGFIATKNKVGIYFVNSEKYLLTFCAKDFGEKFESFDFVELPCARKGFSMFNISDTKVGILGGNGAANGTDFWVYQHTPIPKWSTVKIIGTNYPVISDHASAVVENDVMSFIYTFGGRKNNTITNSLILFIYQNGFCTFREFETNNRSPNPRIKHSFSYYNGGIYLFGGISENGTLLNDFWKLDISINGLLNPIWEPISIKTPPPRYGHHTFIRDGCLYITGGYNSEGYQINDVWKFDGSNWSLVSSFDSSKYIFSSDFGLISFSEIFELEPELPPNNYLNLLYDTLLEKRKEYISQYIEYKKKILYEKEQNQIIQRLSDILKDKSKIQNYKRTIRNVFHHKEEIAKLKDNFVSKANNLLASYKIFIDTEQKNQETYDLSKNLISKLNISKKEFESEMKVHQLELSMLHKQSETLKKLEQLPQPPSIDLEFKKTLDDLINKSDKEIKNQDFLAQYYFTNQYSLYEYNKHIIAELKQEIENTKNQYISKNQEISELLKEIYSTKEMIEKTRSKRQEYCSLLKEIEPQKNYLNEYNKALTEFKNSPEEFQKNLEEIINQNKLKQKQLIDTIEDVTNKKYPLEALFLSVQDIKNYYKRQELEESNQYLSSMIPKLNEITANLFPKQSE